MTVGGWIFLIVCWGIIISLVTFCYLRILQDNGSGDTPEEQ